MLPSASSSRKESMNALNSLARIVATATLCAMLVGTGLFTCCLRPTTALLAQATSNEADSPYGKEALVGLAVLTRDYTVDGGDRAAMLDTIAQAASDASPALKSASDKQAALASLGERYTLTDDALDHLDDVNRVIGVARIAFVIIGVVCVAALAHVLVRCRKKSFGGVLMASGGAVIALFVLLALWVMADFNGFFAAFHSLFFSAGTWTFSYDSLLICMYPPDFWISMGAVWLATTLAGCLICLIIGRLLRKRSAA